MVLKYMSLFSGIGGFEVAIHRIHPRAICVGFSEIDPRAIEVYSKKFPSHSNLGNVKNITKSDVVTQVDNAGGCDLLVAGFPCNDLSTLNTNAKGLDGPSSNLFYDMLRIIKILKHINPNLSVIVENNVGMANTWRNIITSDLRKALGAIYCSVHDASALVVQKRSRFFWTTSPVAEYTSKRIQSWRNVLEPINSISIQTDASHHVSLAKRKNGLVQKRNDASESFELVLVRSGIYKLVSQIRKGGTSRLSSYKHHSDTNSPTSRTIFTSANDSVLFDRRGCPPGQFRLRRFTVKELARLFTFDDDHLPKGTSVNAAYVLFGKAVVVKVVEHVLKHVLK